MKEARRPVRTDLTARCDAVETIGARVAFWAALAEDQGRPVEVLLPTGPVHVVVSGEDLVDVVDILVDNVFAHTPEQAAFSVLVRADSDELHLVVQDRGPGVSVPTSPGRRGTSGLGLDIVARTAAAAGGTLEISSQETGTCVRVSLRRAQD